MKTYIKQKLLDWIIFGFGIIISIVWVGIIYSSWSGYNDLPNTNAWSWLTANMWNNMVAMINKSIKQDSEIITVDNTNGRIWIWTSSPSAKLEVNGDLKISWWLIQQNFWQWFASVMPNDMSFWAWWYSDWSTTSPMPVWIYFYNLYWCAWQNNFNAWAVWNIVFVSGSWSSIWTNYFDNINFWWWSCWNFRTGILQISLPNSTIKLRISWNEWWSNTDTNPTANSVSASFYKIN